MCAFLLSDPNRSMNLLFPSCSTLEQYRKDSGSDPTHTEGISTSYIANFLVSEGIPRESLSLPTFPLQRAEVSVEQLPNVRRAAAEGREQRAVNLSEDLRVDDNEACLPMSYEERVSLDSVDSAAGVLVAPFGKVACPSRQPGCESCMLTGGPDIPCAAHGGPVSLEPVIHWELIAHCDGDKQPSVEQDSGMMEEDGGGEEEEEENKTVVEEEKRRAVEEETFVMEGFRRGVVELVQEKQSRRVVPMTLGPSKLQSVVRLGFDGSDMMKKYGVDFITNRLKNDHNVAAEHPNLPDLGALSENPSRVHARSEYNANVDMSNEGCDPSPS